MERILISFAIALKSRYHWWNFNLGGYDVWNQYELRAFPM